MNLITERKKQREKLFFYLYRIDNIGKLNLLNENNYQFKADDTGEFILEKENYENLILFESQKEYVKTIMTSLKKNHKKIDELIKENLRNWNFERIGDIQRAVLRLALLEILYIDDIDTSVSINEAVDLTKKYSDNNKSKFVNGILGNIVRKSLKNEAD